MYIYLLLSLIAPLFRGLVPSISNLIIHQTLLLPIFSSCISIVNYIFLLQSSSIKFICLKIHQLPHLRTHCIHGFMYCIHGFMYLCDIHWLCGMVTSSHYQSNTKAEMQCTAPGKHQWLVNYQSIEKLPYFTWHQFIIQ